MDITLWAQDQLAMRPKGPSCKKEVIYGHDPEMLLSKLNALWQNGKLHKTSLMVLKCTSAYEMCVLCSWKGSINAK